MAVAEVPGLPGIRVVQTRGQYNLVYETPGVCHCGQDFTANGFQQVRLHDIPRGDQTSILNLRARRWLATCGHTAPHPLQGLRCQAVGDYQPGWTKRLFEEVTDRYLRGIPVTELSEWCGVSQATLHRVVRPWIELQLQQPRPTAHLAGVTHLAIDELFWQGRPLCLILDLVSGRLIECLPDREPETLRAFFADLQTYCPTPPTLVTDMWEPFREAIQGFYGSQMLHVADRFHIQSKVGQDLREAVRELLPVSSERPRSVSQVMQVFMQASGEPLKLAGFKRKYRVHLERLVALASQAMAIWSSASVAEARHHLREWQWQRSVAEHALSKSRFEVRPFARLAYLFDTWEQEILAYFDPALALPDGRRPNSGRLEGVNGQVRELLQRSHHMRRKPYATLAEDWDEQGQYERLWLRIMHRINVKPSNPETFEVRFFPTVHDCPCGQVSKGLNLTQGRTFHQWDMPVGNHPVRLEVTETWTRCPKCGAGGISQGFSLDRVTPALREQLLVWRRQGQSIAELHKRTGVSRRVIQQLTKFALAQPVVRPPYLLGVLRWRWQGRDLWVVTDPEKRVLVDLIEPGSKSARAARSALRSWLAFAYRNGSREILLGDVHWHFFVPQWFELSFDRFSVINAVHQAQRDTVNQVVATRPVAARRAPELRRFRYVFLANPVKHRRLDDRRQAAVLLNKRDMLAGRFQALDIAVERLESLRALFQLTDELSLREGLEDWHAQTERLTDDLERLAGGRGLVHGFGDASFWLQVNTRAVVTGLLRQQRHGIDLGWSRQLLGELKRHPAARQADFEFFRRSALFTLGRQP